MSLSIDFLSVITSPIVIYVLTTFIFPYYYKNEDPTIYLLLTFVVLMVISVSILAHELPTLIYCKLKKIECPVRLYPFFSLKKFKKPLTLKARIVIDISSFFSLVVFSSFLFLPLYFDNILNVPWWIISILDISFKCLLVLIVFHLLPIFPSDIWYILFSISKQLFRQNINSFNFSYKVSLLFNSILIMLSIGMLLYGYFLQGFLIIIFGVYLRYFTIKYIYNEIDTFNILFTDIDKNVLVNVNNLLECKVHTGIFPKSVVTFSINYSNSPVIRVIEQTLLLKKYHNPLLQQIDNDTKLKMLKILINELEIK